MASDTQHVDRELLRHCERAYVVSDAGEESATVVYARNPMEARRIGHCQDDVGSMDHELDLHVHRAPEFDDLGGKGLCEVQLANGWWFTCWHCGSRVTTEPRYDHDTDRKIELEPVIFGERVYCSPWCHGAHAAVHVERRAIAWTAIAATVQRFPGCRVVDVVPKGLPTPHVRFTLPPEHRVEMFWCAGDRDSLRLHWREHIEAWNQYREATDGD
jgi:hypothetical protein